MDKLTRANLYDYLLTIKKAASIQNAKVDPKTMSEQKWAEYCMRDGAARLADELIRQYGLDLSDS